MADAITRPRRRSLARVGGVVVLFLALGAVVNFGVMLWCVRGNALEFESGPVVMTADPTKSGGFPHPSRVDRLPFSWSVAMPSTVPPPIRADGGEYGWLYQTCEEYYSYKGTNQTLRRVARREVGWPARCWWGAVRVFEDSSPSQSSAWDLVRGVQLPPRLAAILGVRWLPIGIHPLPFIANTLVYAAIPFALWLTIGPLRRWRRRRAGRCAACGYNRAGLAAEAKCPECGQVVNA